MTSVEVVSGGLFTGTARYMPQSPWQPIPAILVTIIACAAALMVGFFAVVLAVASAGQSPGEQEAAIQSSISLSAPAGVATAIVSQLVSLVIIWLSAGYQGMRREVLQLAGPMPGWTTIALGGVVLVVATSAVELLMYLTTRFDIFADSRWLRDGLVSPWWWATVVIGVVLAPLWEELTFRGFLMSALAKTRLGFWGAGLISNALWTILHAGYSWQGMVSVFTAGLVLTWVLQRTGSIWAPIFVHAIANTCALAFAYFVGAP